MPLLIGFSGKIGSGKDYIAKEVVGSYLRTMGISYMHMAFSDALKVYLMTTLEGITYETLYEKKTTETRKLLQEVATDFRKKDDKIWIRYLDSWITVYGMRGIDVILISDVRFSVEQEYIKEKGGKVFRIIAPERTLNKMKEETDVNTEEIEKISMHISENGLDDNVDNYDGMIYNDNVDNNFEELLKSIKQYIDNKL